MAKAAQDVRKQQQEEFRALVEQGRARIRQRLAEERQRAADEGRIDQPREPDWDQSTLPVYWRVLRNQKSLGRPGMVAWDPPQTQGAEPRGFSTAADLMPAETIRALRQDLIIQIASKGRTLPSDMQLHDPAEDERWDVMLRAFVAIRDEEEPRVGGGCWLWFQWSQV